MTKRVLILGGTSEIALETAKIFGLNGFAITLTGRNNKELKRVTNHLCVRFALNVTSFAFDILQPTDYLDAQEAEEGVPDVVICFIGSMHNQNDLINNPELQRNIMRTNFEAPAIFLSSVHRKFLKRGWGTIIGISSVAGERGRASNYFYGSAKAGFSTFLSGMRNASQSSNVQITTILPGFVRTRMIENMNTPSVLTASPAMVAESIWRSYENKKDIVYVLKIWRYIMLIIKLIPEKFFKKTNL